MAKYNSAGHFVDDLVSSVKSAAKNQLESNKAINPIHNFTGGVEAVGRIIGGEGISNSLVRTFGKNAVQEGEKWVAKDGLNYGKIAGSYLGVAAAGRVMSGGGVYKDGNGNTNLIGVPFV